MISTRQTGLLILLTAGALGSWYLVQVNRSADVQQAPVETAYRGYYLKSARILGTGEDGHLLYEIEAEHAQQEAQDRKPEHQLVDLVAAGVGLVVLADGEDRPEHQEEDQPDRAEADQDVDHPQEEEVPPPSGEHRDRQQAERDDEAAAVRGIGVQGIVSLVRVR